MKSIRLFLIITSFAFPIISGAQNCSCTNCPLPISEFSTTTTSLDISGATLNNLNQAGQGVCAVLLNFTSNQVMGLEITLTSPAGQSVTLVGQSFLTNQFTGGADWNVVFVPCAFDADPDPGFTDIWSNNQSWQLGGNYSGSYFPNSGCLEGFNMGTVNGTWTLTIENVSDFYTATLFNWTIVFCDNDGIDCYLCTSDAGDLSSYPDLIACESDTMLDLDIPPTYSGLPPDPVNYDYTYVISQNGMIQAYDDNADLSAYPPGEYQVCGMSYLAPDVIYLPLPGTISADDLRDTLNSTTPPFCGDLSDDCIRVVISPQLIQTTVYDTICQGDCLLFGTNSYCMAGIFQDTFATVAGCDSITTLHLAVLPLSMTFQTDTICEGESIASGGNTYSISGLYIDTLQAANGCDSIVQLQLTVLDTSYTIVSSQICQGDTAYIGTMAYTQSGIYTQILLSSNGCDSTVRLQLTVLPHTQHVVNTTICEGDTVSVGSSVYFQPGIYSDTLVNANGCDSVVQLILQVLDTASLLIDTAICQGDTLFAGGSAFAVSGQFTLLLSGANGCDSTLYIDLEVLNPVSTVLSDTICAGDSLTFGNQVLTGSGTYQEAFTGSNGCDSTVTLNLTVVPPITYSQTVQLCTGDTLIVGSTAYTQTGNYTDSLQALSTGCDSIVITQLSVTSVLTTLLVEEICEGQSYPVGAHVYDSTGIYIDTLVSAALGCDSIVELQLTVHPVFFTSMQAVICQGDTFVFHNMVYTFTGVFSDTLTSSQGCDSVVQLVLTVVSPVHTFLNDTLCEGQSTQVGNSVYFQTGNYVDTLAGMTGCDSIVHLQLIVFDSINVFLTDTICSGESVTVGSSTYTMTGQYTDILTSSTGCDSVVHLQLTLLDTDTLIFAFICTGTSFIVGDSAYDQTGQYTTVLPSWFGCDSTVTLFLLVDTAIIVYNEWSICEGNSLVVGDSVYSTSGVYQNTFTSTAGCDSVVNITLSVFPVAFTLIDTALCEGGSIQVGNNTYIVTGSYSDTLNTYFGCDSIIQTDLTIFPDILVTVPISICQGDSVELGGIFYDQTGIYYDTLISMTGCDSVVALQLNVLPQPTFYVEEIICDGEVYMVGDSVFFESGLYQIPFIASNGCDSLFTLDLTVFPNLEMTLDIGICEGSSYPLGDSLLTIPGFYSDTLTTFWGCDSIVHIQLSFVDIVTENVQIQICAGDSLWFGNTWISQPGTYSDTLQSSVGCDSVAIVQLALLDPVYSSITTAICIGDTFYIGNTAYASTGNYVDTLIASTGCDSIVSLQLTVSPFLETFLTASICQGFSYPVGDTSFSITGMHVLVLSASSGCDSIIYLDLTAHPNYILPSEVIICAEDTFYIGNNAYFQSGNYPVLLTSSAGCDSLILLDLTVLPSLSHIWIDTICAGESVQIGDSVYTQAGNYQLVLPSTQGCDSLIQLSLTVLPGYEIFLDQTICAGETVTVGDSIYSATGLYSQTLFTMLGQCDSLVHLNLTVTDPLETHLDTSICQGDFFQAGDSIWTETGQYAATLSASGGCDSLVYVSLSVYPTYQISLSDTLCEGETLLIGGMEFQNTGQYIIPLLSSTGCDSLIVLDLLSVASDTIFLTDTLCTGDVYAVGDSLYTMTGNYVNGLTNRWGCDSLVFSDLIFVNCVFTAGLVYAGDLCAPAADIILTITASGGQAPYAYTLISQVNNLNLTGMIPADGIPVVLNAMPPGDYSLVVTDAFGIVSTDSLFTGFSDPVVANIVNVSDYGGFNVSCADAADGYALGTASGGLPPYAIVWDDTLFNAMLDHAIPGVHTLIVSDQNGCADTLQINLTAPPPIDISLEIRPPTCFGDRNGRVYVSDVTAGQEPYVFALDTEFFTPVRFFEYLEAGPHTLVVRDATGCEHTETFIIPEPAQIDVELGNDQYVYAGDSVHIEAVLNFPDALQEIVWTPAPSCDSCLDYWVLAIEHMFLEAVVIDTNGCFDTDDVRIWVENTLPVFVPTIFSPNGDGINDLAAVFVGQEAEYIVSFRIFDRFGEMVFEATEYLPGDLAGGWDGNHRGAPMNPQVFVYCAEIKMKDRSNYLIKGDITLIR